MGFIQGTHTAGFFLSARPHKRAIVARVPQALHNEDPSVVQPPLRSPLATLNGQHVMVSFQHGWTGLWIVVWTSLHSD